MLLLRNLRLFNGYLHCGMCSTNIWSILCGCDLRNLTEHGVDLTAASTGPNSCKVCCRVHCLVCCGTFVPKPLQNFLLWCKISPLVLLHCWLDNWKDIRAVNILLQLSPKVFMSNCCYNTRIILNAWNQQETAHVNSYGTCSVLFVVLVFRKSYQQSIFIFCSWSTCTLDIRSLRLISVLKVRICSI